MLSYPMVAGMPFGRKEGGRTREENSLEELQTILQAESRCRAKEFHGLYVEMEKRAKGLQATLQAGDLPKAGIAYGRILEVCASCHGKFRD